LFGERLIWPSLYWAAQNVTGNIYEHLAEVERERMRHIQREEREREREKRERERKILPRQLETLVTRDVPRHFYDWLFYKVYKCRDFALFPVFKMNENISELKRK